MRLNAEPEHDVGEIARLMGWTEGDTRAAIDDLVRSDLGTPSESGDVIATFVLTDQGRMSGRAHRDMRVTPTRNGEYRVGGPTAIGDTMTVMPSTSAVPIQLRIASEFKHLAQGGLALVALVDADRQVEFWHLHANR